MWEIKRIKSLSLANVTAAIYGLVGFFIALVVAISTMANIVMQKDFIGSVFLVTLFNVGTGVLLGLAVAVVAALLGWVVGFITAAFYNMFASRLGGIKIELAEARMMLEKEEKENKGNETDEKNDVSEEIKEESNINS